MYLFKKYFVGKYLNYSSKGLKSFNLRFDDVVKPEIFTERNMSELLKTIRSVNGVSCNMYKKDYGFMISYNFEVWW